MQHISQSFRYAILLAILVAITSLSGCKKVSLDFSYSPLEPRAGEQVTFTNLSSGGSDSYTWNFGDNQTATSKNATHTFRQPGTYIVTLTTKKSNKVCQRPVVVGSPEPTITATQDTIAVFERDTLIGKAWNPYKHTVSYEWSLGEDVQLLQATTNNDTIIVYFTREGEETVQLTVKDGDVTSAVSTTIKVTSKAGSALLIQTSSGAYYQRYYNPWYEAPQPLEYQRGKDLLNAVTDALTAEDRMERKTYGGGDKGLYVYNIGGTDSVCITSEAVSAVAISATMNRLFYAVADDGVYALPLIHTPNNRYTDKPAKVNTLLQVTCLAIDLEPF